MHVQQMNFVELVKTQFPHFFESAEMSVLEIGSRNVNGTCRTLFNSKKYIGIDLMEGPDVDLVCHVKDYVCPEASFDVVISCEALEHDVYWKQTLSKAHKLLKPSGLLVVTCAGPLRPEHGIRRSSPKDSPATIDYYENRTPYEILSSFNDGEFVKCLAVSGNNGQDTYFWGIKS